MSCLLHCGVQIVTLLVMFIASGSVAHSDQPKDQLWRYTLQAPSVGWQRADFDDSDWKQGPGGFGTRGTPGARVGTIWNSEDIWIRRTFEISEIPRNPALFIHHDEDAEVYINGVKVALLAGWSVDYKIVKIPAEHRAAIKSGRNLLAVHCHQSSGGQYIDVLFADADNPPALPAASPFKSELITEWGSQVTAENVWTEYPRPQLQRKDWQNLNGDWDYTVTSDAQKKIPDSWEGKLLVPFCLESKLGGVQRLLGESETLWYRRSFNVAAKDDRRTILNFEAVDYQSEVFINGTSVGQHKGGNTPFAFDVTDALIQGQNELVVRVEDDTEAWQLNGKQRRNPSGIFYTQVSGIWQTVWLERVEKTHIVKLLIQTDVESGTITIRPEIAGDASECQIHVKVTEGEENVASATSDGKAVSIKVANAKLWSPKSPHLYGLLVSLVDGDGNSVDEVRSYAGIRSVGKSRDADGHLRMTLNGKEIFHWGPLDQGWWPDGLLTPPSDEAMLFEIEWLKSAGFNMIRKHIKVEPRRYYYHCDRLGILVWQDQVSAGKSPPWTRLKENPKDADWPDAEHKQFMLELERMIAELESHPSIVMWVPFNEAWGQHRTMKVGKWTTERDTSRLVNVASGGNFWPVGDIVDQHSYPHPSFPSDKERYKDFVKVVGEFGGHGFPVKGHLWDTERRNWGYGGLPKTKEEYRDRYVKSLEILDELRGKGVAAGVYTQTSDVEGEINGLMTYDRKVIKIPAKELRALHQRLME
jgi:beta-galactosidase/beta-glucuronidase